MASLNPLKAQASTTAAANVTVVPDTAQEPADLIKYDLAAELFSNKNNKNTKNVLPQIYSAIGHHFLMDAPYLFAAPQYSGQQPPQGQQQQQLGLSSYERYEAEHTAAQDVVCPTPCVYDPTGAFPSRQDTIRYFSQFVLRPLLNPASVYHDRFVLQVRRHTACRLVLASVGVPNTSLRSGGDAYAAIKRHEEQLYRSVQRLTAYTSLIAALESAADAYGILKVTSELSAARRLADQLKHPTDGPVAAAALLSGVSGAGTGGLVEELWPPTSLTSAMLSKKDKDKREAADKRRPDRPAKRVRPVDQLAALLDVRAVLRSWFRGEPKSNRRSRRSKSSKSSSPAQSTSYEAEEEEANDGNTAEADNTASANTGLVVDIHAKMHVQHALYVDPPAAATNPARPLPVSGKYPVSDATHPNTVTLVLRAPSRLEQCAADVSVHIRALLASPETAAVRQWTDVCRAAGIAALTQSIYDFDVLLGAVHNAQGAKGEARTFARDFPRLLEHVIAPRYARTVARYLQWDPTNMNSDSSAIGTANSEGPQQKKGKKGSQANNTRAPAALGTRRPFGMATEMLEALASPTAQAIFLRRAVELLEADTIAASMKSASSNGHSGKPTTTAAATLGQAAPLLLGLSAEERAALVWAAKCQLRTFTDAEYAAVVADAAFQAAQGRIVQWSDAELLRRFPPTRTIRPSNAARFVKAFASDSDATAATPPPAAVEGEEDSQAQNDDTADATDGCGPKTRKGIAKQQNEAAIVRQELLELEALRALCRLLDPHGEQRYDPRATAETTLQANHRPPSELPLPLFHFASANTKYSVRKEVPKTRERDWVHVGELDGLVLDLRGAVPQILAVVEVKANCGDLAGAMKQRDRFTARLWEALRATHRTTDRRAPPQQLVLALGATGPHIDHAEHPFLSGSGLDGLIITVEANAADPVPAFYHAVFPLTPFNALATLGEGLIPDDNGAITPNAGPLAALRDPVGPVRAAVPAANGPQRAGSDNTDASAATAPSAAGGNSNGKASRFQKPSGGRGGGGDERGGRGGRGGRGRGRGGAPTSAAPAPAGPPPPHTMPGLGIGAVTSTGMPHSFYNAAVRMWVYVTHIPTDPSTPERVLPGGGAIRHVLCLAAAVIIAETHHDALAAIVQAQPQQQKGKRAAAVEGGGAKSVNGGGIASLLAHSPCLQLRRELYPAHNADAAAADTFWRRPPEEDFLQWRSDASVLAASAHPNICNDVACPTITSVHRITVAREQSTFSGAHRCPQELLSELCRLSSLSSLVPVPIRPAAAAEEDADGAQEAA